MSSKTNIFYLEHYLKALEELPTELRNNFSTMKDLDVKNRHILQQVDAKSDDYLQRVQEMSGLDRKAEMEKIQSMFSQAKQFGDEKVSIAIQTYELVDKHIRKLDADLAKFEAEMREKGRLSQTEDESELDEPVVVTKKNKGGGNKKVSKVTEDPFSDSDSVNRKHNKNDKKSNRKKNDIKDNDKRSQDSSSKHQDKKSTSKKSKSDWNESKSSDTSSKNYNTPLPDMSENISTAALSGDQALLPASASSLFTVPQEVLDMPVDPNEPTYCLCQQVSYGEMIGCDNLDCPIEWFHFGCINLTHKPKGKWYCPKCLPLFKKKK